MDEISTFKFNSVNLRNLTELSQRESHLKEQRICELSEISESAFKTASMLYDSGYNIYEILSVLSDEIPKRYSALHKSYMEENLARLKAHLSLLERGDKVLFAELFLERLLSGGIPISELDFLKSEHSGARIAYVKSALCDEAYDVFSEELPSPRLSYSKSFSEAVGKVISGECEYCILPLEERGGVRVSTVSELIFKHDLKINSVTPVFGFDGIADTKYALLSKSFSVPKLESGDDRYLEIRLKASGAFPLSEAIFAAEGYGASIYRINTVIMPDDEGKNEYYSVVFRDDAADFTRLLTYLTLFSATYTAVGIYKNLE